MTTARSSARRRTRAVVERLDADCNTAGIQLKNVLCLISATQTGTLAEHMKAVFETSAVTLNPRFVALFALGSHDIPYLHDLSADPRFVLLEDRADRTGEPVEIDPQVYFPLQFEDSVIQIDKSLADRSRAFFDRYVGTDVIEIHRDHLEDAGRPRHHAIHLATERLLDVPGFSERLEERLAYLPSPPFLIVSPPHTAGRRLAEHAQQFFKKRVQHCEVVAHPNLYLPPDPLQSEDRRVRNMLRGAGAGDSLLIIDDVCITGTRLSQYQRYVRTERFPGRVDYLVGVARPSHPRVWSNLQRYLRFRSNGLPHHTVDEVDFVLLPDWRDEECPWCREKGLYERWLKGGPLPELLTSRLEQLSRSAPSTGANDIFLVVPELPQMQLGPDSLFVREGSNQAEVFAAVAAAIQHLRCETATDRPRLGPRHFPVSTVLDHRDYLCSKWTDSVLRATFFRAASTDELTYADSETESQRTRALHDLLGQPADGEHDIALEILLAANMQKCRLTISTELLARLEQYGSPDVVSYLVAKISELPPGV